MATEIIEAEDEDLEEGGAGAADKAKKPDPAAVVDPTTAAKTEAESALLKSLGFTDLGKAKAYLDGQRQKERDALTAEEKVNRDIEDRDKTIEELTTKQEAAKGGIIRSSIEGIAQSLSAEHPEDVVGWVLQNRKPDDLWDDKSFAARKDQVDAAVKECKKQRPTWFKGKGSDSPGTLSNHGGSTPRPDSRRIADAQKKQAAKTRKGF